MGNKITEALTLGAIKVKCVSVATKLDESIGSDESKALAAKLGLTPFELYLLLGTSLSDIYHS